MHLATRRTGLRFSLRSRQAVLAAVLLVLCPIGLEAQVHAFYGSALEAGKAAYERGDFDLATERLRMASFGMLDQPALLAEALTRLGLAQAAAGQREDFVATFERISRIEEQFNGYSTSLVPASLRARYEQQVAEWVPAETLAASTAFARLYREQETQRLQMLLPPDRVAALEELVRADPDDLARQVMLAAARVENRSGADAIPALESMVNDRPDAQRIACLLGRAYLQAESCNAVLQAPLETVQRCDVRRLPTAELVQYFECLASTERWIEAASVIVSLPPERRGKRPFPNWEKRVARRLPPETQVDELPPYRAAIDPVVSGPRAPEVPTPSAAAQPAASAPRKPAIAPAELANLRSRLNEARTVSELMEVVEAAERLDEKNPRAGSEALDIAGEAAYRASQWQLAADHLRASGGPPDDRPDLLFYLSVSLYELGDFDGARESLVRALPGLERTTHVERYRQQILESDR